MLENDRPILALCGGVGGAKLAFGLTQLLPPAQLAIVTNTGDDFEHLGLHISPDLDTVMYTLAGLNNPDTGWGLCDETWNMMHALGRLGGETWFNLGDQDIATHLERTRRLRAGERLTEVTVSLCHALGVSHPVLPMTDDPVSTVVDTDAGPLDFQRYFVEQQCQPRISAIRYPGAESAAPSPEFLAKLNDPKLGAIIICPSNPFLSVDPILEVADIRKALIRSRAPVVAVSPIVGGEALKGPAAKIMGELGLAVSASAVAQYYGRLLDGFVLDEIDAAQAESISALGPRTCASQTIMRTAADKVALAEVTLAFARSLMLG